MRNYSCKTNSKNSSYPGKIIGSASEGHGSSIVSQLRNVIYKVNSHKMADKLLATTTCWNDVEEIMNGLSSNEKGIVFERLTQLYLELDPVFNQKLKRIWLLHELPSRVAQDLKIPAEDIGIDLVAEAHNGDFWAIQTKYRENNSASITYEELSTFLALADSISKRFSFKLFASSSERVSRKLDRLDDFGLLLSDTWRNLGADFFESMAATLSNRPSKVIPFQPKEHQQKAIESALEHFSKDQVSRGKLIAPCGSGKSLTAYWISERMKSNRILIAVPSLTLIKQTLRTWMRELSLKKQSVDWLCVCSDKSVAEVDELMADTHDLGIPCTTNASDIAEWLSSQTTNQKKIVFTTYQSGETLAEAARQADYLFDLGIMDEAHKTTGRKDKLFSHLLFDENVRIEKRLFMTATERFFSGNSPERIASMEDPNIYGSTFFRLSFKDAIRAVPPILCDYRIIVMEAVEEEVASLIGSNRYVLPDKYNWSDIPAEEIASLIGFNKAVRQYKIKRTISFHSSVRRAESFLVHQKEFSRSETFETEITGVHVSGAMQTTVRDRQLRVFSEAKIGLVTNARCLTEGVDVPAVDGVLFADPKKSTLDIVQAAGRAMRLAADKQTGYIIVPLFLRKEMTTEELIDSSPFKHVMHIIGALASNDARIIEYFRTVAAKKRTLSSGESSDIVEIIPTDVSLARFTEAIRLHIWKKLAKLSWRTFEDAREFARHLNLRSNQDWRKFSKSEQKPEDIPANPDRIYQGHGWRGWGDFLGTGNLLVRDFKAFEDARNFVQALKLKDAADYRRWSSQSRPNDIPSAPDITYKNNGWISWGDWLGTGAVSDHKKEWCSFDKARDFAQKQGLKTHTEWREFCQTDKKPENIPSAPNRIYKDCGWVSWGDFLGSGNVHSGSWRTFTEARKYAQSLGLKRLKDWTAFAKSDKRPRDIPSKPQEVYKGEWTSWGDFLGTGNVSSQKVAFLPFEEAKEFVQKQGIASETDWRKYTKNPSFPRNIPKAPDQTYRDKGWISWGDWLGTGARRSINWREFEEARDFARGLGLKDVKSWRRYWEFSDRPEDIPANPDVVYSDWQSWGDWLGTGSRHPSKVDKREFKDARNYARRLNLRGEADWRDYLRSTNEHPPDIPRKPDQYYKGRGWISWGDWLGTGRVKRGEEKRRSFEDARQFVHQLGLRSENPDWRNYCSSGRKPNDIPSAPHRAYQDEWISWGDWLGTYSKHRGEWLPFEEAREIIRKEELSSESDWREFKRQGKKPNNIPADPHRVYKGKGWISWSDWLGNKRSKRKADQS